MFLLEWGGGCVFLPVICETVQSNVVRRVATSGVLDALNRPSSCDDEYCWERFMCTIRHIRSSEADVHVANDA